MPECISSQFTHEVFVKYEIQDLMFIIKKNVDKQHICICTFDNLGHMEAIYTRLLLLVHARGPKPNNFQENEASSFEVIAIYTFFFF